MATSPVPVLTTTQIEIALSGVGDIDIFNLDLQTLNVLISGIGNVSIAGQVRNQTADIVISSSGSATVQVSTTLNAHITGRGSVFLYWQPVVNRTGNGIGNVAQLFP